MNFKYKLLTLFIFLFASFAFSNKVLASVLLGPCENDKTCLAVCNYTNSFGTTKAKNITIYHNLDTKKWRIIYEKYNTPNSTVKSTSWQTYENFFSTSRKNIYVQNIPNESNFKCPTYGYIDASTFGFDEFCFDDDGLWCSTEHSDLTTHFGVASDFFKSTVIDYTVTSDLDSYFSETSSGDREKIFDGLSCEDVINESFDPTTDIGPRITDYINVNYFDGYTSPDFIKNSNIWENIGTSVSTQYNTFADKCKKDAKTRADKEKFNVSDESISTQTGEAVNLIKTGIKGSHTADLEFVNCENITDEVEKEACLKNLDNSSDLEKFCNSIFTDDSGKKNGLHEFLKTLITGIKILAPILFILVSMIDFTKSTIDSEAMSKAKKNFVTRGIIVVIIIMLPTLINLLLGIIGLNACMI